MSEKTAPRRRWRMELNLQADTLADMMRELHHIHHRLLEAEYRREPQIRVTSGGKGSGFTLAVDEDPDMDHGRYVEALNAYLGRKSS